MEKSLFHWQEWTVDRIEQQIKDSTVQTLLRDQEKAPITAFRKVLEDLDALVEEGHMERTLRRLEIPSQIGLSIYGKAVYLTTKDFDLGKDNKYQDNVSFTESARIQFSGADYYTPDKHIVLVPRPKVASFVTNRWEPAYIYYRLQGVVEKEAAEPDPEKRLLLKQQDRQAQLELRGKRQQYLNVPARITEQACYIEVPISGDLELIGEANEDLREEVLVLPAGKGEDEKKTEAVPPEATRARFLKEGAGLSRRKFSLSFKNLTQVQAFKLRLVNDDGVVGECTVVITPKADDHPRVDVQMIRNVFRMKDNVGFMVTPVAEVPFQGTISDDRGLSRVEWRFKVAPYTEEAVATKLATMLTALHFTPGGFSQNMSASSYLTILLKQMAEAEGDGGKKALPATTALQLTTGGFSHSLMAAAHVPWLATQTGKVEDVESRLMKRFIDEIVKRKKTEMTPEDMIAQLTQQPPKEGPLTQVSLRTEDDFFSFEEYLGYLKTAGDKVFQKRYVVELWVAATDNNIETDQPVVSEDKKHFTFLVVGENDLLAEIYREEEKLRAALDLIHDKLKTAKARLDNQVMPGLAESVDRGEVRRRITRTEEVKEDIAASNRDIGSILSAFGRILEELKANKIEKVKDQVQENIYDPLREMQDRKTGAFKAAEDAAHELQLLLERDLKTQGPGKTARDVPPKDRQERNKAGLDAKEKLDQLIKRLEKVLGQIREVVGKDQLLLRAIKLEQDQRKQSELMEAHLKYLEKILKLKAIGANE
jgi:hypothetical protein